MFRNTKVTKSVNDHWLGFSKSELGWMFHVSDPEHNYDYPHFIASESKAPKAHWPDSGHSVKQGLKPMYVSF